MSGTDPATDVSTADKHCRSLDNISKTIGPIRVDVLGKIAEAVLGGLVYLYRDHRIMHRDIKPSNILVNSGGAIKLCDFGVSSELENSVANTFVGTGTYMAPERIQGSAYTVQSDVWSFGLTLMELAIGKFPFASGATNDDGDDLEASGGPQGILDLLQQIVGEPSPKLPKSDAFPYILEAMLDRCLMKESEDRPTPQDLYVRWTNLSYLCRANEVQDFDPFLQAARNTNVDLRAWASSVTELQGSRTRHLESLRHDASTPTSSSANPTPTSIESSIALLSIGDDQQQDMQAIRPWPVRTSSAQTSAAFPVRSGRTTAFTSETFPVRSQHGEGPLPPVPPKPKTMTNNNPGANLTSRDNRKIAAMKVETRMLYERR